MTYMTLFSPATKHRPAVTWEVRQKFNPRRWVVTRNQWPWFNTFRLEAAIRYAHRVARLY